MRLDVSLLADALGSVEGVARMRWQEWGHPPEPEDPAWWLDVTVREAGRDELPVTFVAHDESGDVLGAVGLDHYDLDERHDTTPWVTGMIVRPDLRGHGVGRELMRHLERWAGEHDVVEAWVGTESAAGFYERCRWIPEETFTDSAGQRIDVLHKSMPRRPVPFETYREGVYLHGTRADLSVGDLLVPGRESNYEAGRMMNFIYFTATLDAAAWGAEFALGEGPERIYLVEPTGDFEDDPNVTDKKLPGNPTQSFRSRASLRVVGELDDWVGHSPEKLRGMREGLAALRQRGEAIILD